MGDVGEAGMLKNETKVQRMDWLSMGWVKVERIHEGKQRKGVYGFDG